ncbi:MAG TPA: FecR family protein [Acidiferrobacterales bacterium]|nr:FecR family protein [Acidiferrobacterales bacterium]
MGSWRIAGLMAMLIASPAALADIGVFTETSGDVKLLRGEYYFAATPGVEVQEQDIVETGADASTQIEMTDGSVLRLGANSRLVLSEYRLDSEGGVIKANLDVLAGWLRFVVAKLRSNAEYAIDTPTMTVGVRGTEGVIEAKSTQGGLYLEEGAVEAKAPDMPGQQVAQLKAGEYIERAHGHAFQHFRAPPPAFHNRIPPACRQRLQRRARFLRQRGVPPRQIRRITREDAQRYLQQHPHRRQMLDQRFKTQRRNNSEIREKAQHRNQERGEEHPRRRRDRSQGD